MIVVARGLAPFTPVVSWVTKRKVSPLCGVAAPVEWLQVPQSLPSLTPGSSLTDLPSRQSLLVWDSKLTTVAVSPDPGSLPTTAPARYPARRQKAPPARNTGVGRVTFPTRRAW